MLSIDRPLHAPSRMHVALVVKLDRLGWSMRYGFLVAAILFSFPVQAVDIKREVGSDGIDLIFVSGTFTEGDDVTFRRLAAASAKAVVVLDSGGGNLHAGLAIGRAIRLSGFATAVSPDALCALACAPTWLAGSPRHLDVRSRLGFHAAYRLVNGKASDKWSSSAPLNENKGVGPTREGLGQ